MVDFKKITEEDYVLDFVDTVNKNFESAKEAFDDLNEVINEGNGEFSSLKNNVNGSIDDPSYMGKGKIHNDGDIESTETLRSKHLNVSQTSTFNGTSNFKEVSTFEKNVSFDGQINQNGHVNQNKSISIPTRTIDSLHSMGLVAGVNDVYSFSIENDYCLILKLPGVDNIITPTFALTGAKRNQIIKVTVSQLSGAAFIRLNDVQRIRLENTRETITLLWNQVIEETNTGEWIVLDYSLGINASGRII